MWECCSLLLSRAQCSCQNSWGRRAGPGTHYCKTDAKELLSVAAMCFYPGPLQPKQGSVCHHTLSSSPHLPDTVVLWVPDQELLSPILLTRKNQNLFPPWVKHSSCPKLDQQQMGFKTRAVQEMVCEAMHQGKARLGGSSEQVPSSLLHTNIVLPLSSLSLHHLHTTYTLLQEQFMKTKHKPAS